MTTLTVRNLRTSTLLHHGQLFQRVLPINCSLPRPRCLASTSTTVTKTNPTTNVNPTKPLSKVNGPLSTLPAPLNLPIREPNQSFFPSYAFKLGKAYATFYKSGVLNIYRNFQSSRPLQRLLTDKHKSSLAAAVSSGALTRSDFQLLTRNWHDMKRVPVFALVFLICGEFTPLVVIAISSIVPWTCRIPRQIESDREKLEKRRKSSFRDLTVPPPSSIEGVDDLNRVQLMHISTSLGLSSRMWDYFDALLTDGLLRRKVRRRVDYLRWDDTLIGKGGGVVEMSTDERRMACVERGIDVIGRGDVEVRRSLEAWVRSAEVFGRERLLLTRPSVWPVQAAGTRKKESERDF